jgi:endonuclease YncB( thermonuclease family)
VYVGSIDVNAEMVRRGAAGVYRKYAKDPSLYELGKGARAARRGIWASPA